MAFPGDLTIWEDANRADGTAHAGGGSTIWQNARLGGGASSLIVVDNQLSVTTSDGGALTVREDEDFLFTIDVPDSGAGYFAWFYRLQAESGAPWEGYWFIVQGGSWRFNKRVGGTTVELDAVGHATLTDGDSLGIRVLGDLHELYSKSAGVWDPTPVISVTDSDITGAGTHFLNLDATDYRLDNLREGDPTLPAATSPVTMYVDADHPDADDNYSRTQASDPDTPLFSVQQAAMLAVATPTFADTISVKPAANANPDDTVDTRMYKGFDHLLRRTAEFPAGLPFGDNSANLPIQVIGEVVDDEKPLIDRITGHRLKNWQFENLQVGYDIGSGHDNAFLSYLFGCADLKFTACDFTGGGTQCDSWTGMLEYDSCLVRGPLGPLGTTHNGRGFGFSSDPTGSGDTVSAGSVYIHDCTITNCLGDDAMQIGMGEPDDERVNGGLVRVEDNVFYNNTENAPGGDPLYHTDSIQILGVPEIHIKRNVFVGNTNTLMASDFHNGKVVYENNLAMGAGGLIQMQGTSEFIMRHNTLAQVPGPNLDATIILFHRYDLPEPPKLTIVNNVLGGIYDSRADPHFGEFHEDSLIANNVMMAFPGANFVGGEEFPVNVAGVPEFGTSARMTDLPHVTYEYGDVGQNYELANVPSDSPGIGDGQATDMPVDRLGRSYADPPDCGCHQSDPGTAVTPVARPPYVILRTPGANAVDVAAGANVELLLYPVPGADIDAATVIAANAFLRDPANVEIPLSSLSLVDEGDGYWSVVMDPDGTLYPYVRYSATITSGVADTDGTHLGSSVIWFFRIVGPAPAPAIYSGAPPGGGDSSGWHVGSIG